MNTDKSIMEMLADTGVIKVIKEEEYVNFCKDFQKNFKKVLTNK